MLDSLERTTVTKHHAELLARDCAVCQEKFVEQAESIKLPCLHHFHASCIIPWLSKVPAAHQNNSCPVCRKSLEA